MGSIWVRRAYLSTLFDNCVICRGLGGSHRGPAECTAVDTLAAIARVTRARKLSGEIIALDHLSPDEYVRGALIAASHSGTKRAHSDATHSCRVQLQRCTKSVCKRSNAPVSAETGYPAAYFADIILLTTSRGHWTRYHLCQVMFTRRVLLLSVYFRHYCASFGGVISAPFVRCVLSVKRPTVSKENNLFSEKNIFRRPKYTVHGFWFLACPWFREPGHECRKIYFVK